MSKKVKAVVNQDAEKIDMNHVPLGTRMKDLVTGFEGIAIARVEFMNGCIQYMLKPQKLDKDGKTLEASADVYDYHKYQVIDSEQLVVVNSGIAKKEEKEHKEKKSTGGIMSDTPKC